MSAYVCDDTKITKVVVGLELASEGRPSLEGTLQRQDVARSKRRRATLGQLLLSMNIDAVQQCYRQELTEDEKLPYEVEVLTEVDVDDIRDAMEGFLYQCSEGDVPSSPLFQRVQDAMNRLPVAA